MVSCTPSVMVTVWTDVDVWEEILISSAPGFSNTLPAGLMWPARCICAARKHSEKYQNYKFWSKKAYLRASLVNCGPQKLFFLKKLWPAEHFFFGMWPSNIFEFENLSAGQRRSHRDIGFFSKQDGTLQVTSNYFITSSRANSFKPVSRINVLQFCWRKLKLR